ncbi:conjugal transfer protein [Pantoea sp. SIMBA_079]|uniref:conjugal transfer protein n=1 Tax=Pantoea sp. SIMBA_079 TaxID=3085817 RepID=UPI003995D166
MAALDPIHFESVYKLFPTLTLLQVTDACLYSTGATYREIGELRGVSSETIKKSLEAAQKRLSISGLQSLKVVFLSRLFIDLSLPISNPKCSDKVRADDFDLLLSDTRHFESLLPELPAKLVSIVLFYCSGYDMARISALTRKSADEVIKALEMAMARLKVETEHSLRQVTLARLIINLTLGSHKKKNQ